MPGSPNPLLRRTLRSLLGARALLAFVAALALLASQGLSVLHFVLVPHHLCEVHGTLEDGPARAKASKPEPANRAVAVTTSEDGKGDTHEACTVAALARHGIDLPRTQPPVVEIGGEIQAVASGRSDVKPDRAAVLSRAPKLSPPALG